MDAQPFDTFHDILRCLSLVQSLLKDRNAQTGTNAYETVGLEWDNEFDEFYSQSESNRESLGEMAEKFSTI